MLEARFLIADRIGVDRQRQRGRNRYHGGNAFEARIRVRQFSTALPSGSFAGIDYLQMLTEENPAGALSGEK